MTPQDVLEQIKKERMTMFEAARVYEKLNQFRRHRDWKTAFNHIVETLRYQFFRKYTDAEGTEIWGLPEENAVALIDCADQEFIDRIIFAEREVAA